MIQYTEDEFKGLSLKGVFSGAKEGNSRYIRAIAEVEKGDAEIVPYEQEPPSSLQIRDEALAALIHDFGDGRVMQTRPKDESNIRNAVEIMEANSIPTLVWRMEDNTLSAVTADELKIALAAGQLAGLQVWGDYNTPGQS